jgi:hypothetical protein
LLQYFHIQMNNPIILIFGVILLWIISKTVIQIIQTQKHLTEDDLFNLMRNKLNKYGPEHSRIIHHLGGCEKCQKRLEEYSQRDDI